MNMDWVRSIPTGAKAPELRLTEGNLEVNAIRVILFAVNTSHPVESEETRGHRVSELGNHRERSWDRVIVCDSSRHIELKQDPAAIDILEIYLGTNRQPTEIYEEIEPFSGAELDLAD